MKSEQSFTPILINGILIKYVNATRFLKEKLLCGKWEFSCDVSEGLSVSDDN